jgi:hypothetical protein
MRYKDGQRNQKVFKKKRTYHFLVYSDNINLFGKEIPRGRISRQEKVAVEVTAEIRALHFSYSNAEQNHNVKRPVPGESLRKAAIFGSNDQKWILQARINEEQF